MPFATLGYGARGVACALAAILAAATSTSGPAVAEATALTLADDFEAAGFVPGGGLFYKQGDEQRGGRVTFGVSPAHRGSSAMSLSTAPSCRPTIRGCSERAEVWERPEALAAYGQSVWYGIAMRLDAPIPRDDGRYVMAQWKREILPGAARDYSPFLAVRLLSGRLAITIETDLIEALPAGGPARPDGCLPGEARVLTRRGVRQTRALVAIEDGSSPSDYPGYFSDCAAGIRVARHSDLPKADTGWIDFVFRVMPDPRGEGRIDIIANGRAIATVTGHIGHVGPGLGSNQYFKFGPYRSPSPASWTVSFDDFRRGAGCADVTRTGVCPPP